MRNTGSSGLQGLAEYGDFESLDQLVCGQRYLIFINRGYRVHGFTAVYKNIFLFPEQIFLLRYDSTELNYVTEQLSQCRKLA